MKNNNKEVIALLAKKSYKDNKGRNKILTAAVAFVVIMLFGVFSLSIGKIESDYLLYIRTAGTAAYTSLERPSKEQAEIIKNLSYIKETGETVDIGYTEAFGCEVLDEDAYQHMQKPAYTDINGAYPQKEDEIMLPVRGLEALGIETPQLGMEIVVEIHLVNGENLKKAFYLSGYYTEYVDPLTAAPKGYFSQAFLDTLDIDKEYNTTLLIQQNDTIVDDFIENLLYRDVPMSDDTQQFIGGIAMTRQVIYEMTGGFDTAFALMLLILGGAYLLLHNVLHISLNRDIRQYGLLKTLGTTKKQLRSIVYRQVAYTVLPGCLIGSTVGCILILFVVPRLLSDMYLKGLGQASAMIAFRPWILVGANLFGASVVFISAAFAMRRVVKMSPLEASRYMERTASEGKKERRSTEGGSIFRMAWRNIFRFRRRLIITVLSLVLGITVSLGAVVISKGTDTTHEIDYNNPDFTIHSHMSALSTEQSKDEDIFFEPALRDEILSLDGIQDSEIMHGGFARVSSSEKALAIRFEAEGFDIGEAENEQADRCMVVQVLEDKYLDELGELAAEKNLYIDVDAVKNGEGLIIMHNHSLSKIMTEKSRETIGMPLVVYNLDKDKAETMTLSGYLDFKEKGLPPFKRTWNGPGILYFITSQKGFENTGLADRTFGITLDVDEEKEPLLKIRLNNLVQANNRSLEIRAESEGEELLNQSLYMLAKSDMLEAARDYISASRIVMGVLCTILILMGLVNYINVTMTGLTMRRKEFAVMESIGLTRKQLQNMILLEGVFYSVIVAAATVVMGSAALFGLKMLMKKRIAYFAFTYPALELAACIAALFAVCIVIPLFMYKKAVGESVIDRLRSYTD
ncbi:ABC transporter permease [Bariatricus massiliensis]|uniref:ABC transporter permease n=1 Tax=Bariatricus massiliensis TaxID=1745713 RepID=A0ABS8DGP1_9FIRM|nr:ABC transporter permease [Bariatricus massiliensis]MCB7304472.1 ABC transporter permease [Bariatricus massiliensis]MCB7375124.1 ABC transporter permease [Bariatricus massiliensis]MCB7387583.1 ABC transporter permease [Bariatricus massiliensis]MCB7411744.1 ABC transporter permease [Bariatricus massiliensis]MCQ5253880.1 ABC transporter permease [Bariatricus massiliensis]